MKENIGKLNITNTMLAFPMLAQERWQTVNVLTMNNYYLKRIEFSFLKVTAMKIAKKVLNLSIVFTVFCTCLFIMKLIECVSIFLKKETLNKSSTENQENFPLPLICIEAKTLRLNKMEIFGLNPQGYKFEGVWSSNKTEQDEESIYENINYSFQDLVHGITAQVNVDPDSDYYKTIELKGSSHDEKTFLFASENISAKLISFNLLEYPE